MTLTKSGILGPALPWGNEDVEVEDGGKEADEKEVDEEKEGKEEEGSERRLPGAVGPMEELLASLNHPVTGLAVDFYGEWW